MNRTVKVMVVDTVGEGISQIFLEKLPNLSVSYIQPASVKGTKQHPHGGWCLWDMAAQIPENIKIEALMCRIFDGEGRPIDGSDEFWLKAWRDFRPDYITCSWGAHASDRVNEMFLRMTYNQEYKDKIDKLIDETNSDIFFAAGNEGDLLLDDDVDFPQAMLHNDKVHVIGACDANGVPAIFSGDGFQVDAIYLGVRTASVDPFSGKWVYWSGTSSATPRACGDAIVNGVKGVDIINRYIISSTIMLGWVRGTRSKKAGFGCMQWSALKNILITGKYPKYENTIDPRCIKVIAHDFLWQ